MKRWASGGIILSVVATRRQLGLTFQAGAVTLLSRAATPHGTCEAAMNDASSGRTLQTAREPHAFDRDGSSSVSAPFAAADHKIKSYIPARHLIWRQDHACRVFPETGGTATHRTKRAQELDGAVADS